MKNVIFLEEKDHVAVVSDYVGKGEKLWFDFNGEKVEFEALDDIPMYHKIAVKEIKEGEDVIRYGEKIGRASQDISIGNHVHEHNVDHY